MSTKQVTASGGYLGATMNYQAILARIIQEVDSQAYLTPAEYVEERHRDAMQEIASLIQRPDFEPEAARARAHQMHEQGRIDRVLLCSALHVIAASPRVQDFREAARLVGEQELAALDQGGPNLDANLASCDRHRGVLAYLKGQYEVALDYFSRALERQRTAENLGNILCTLIRLGELDEADALVGQIRRNLPWALVSQLDGMIEQDPDLALLRTEAS